MVAHGSFQRHSQESNTHTTTTRGWYSFSIWNARNWTLEIHDWNILVHKVKFRKEVTNQICCIEYSLKVIQVLNHLILGSTWSLSLLNLHLRWFTKLCSSYHSWWAKISSMMIHYLVLQHVYSRVSEFISMLCTIMHWSRNLKILLGHPF